MRWRRRGRAPVGESAAEDARQASFTALHEEIAPAVYGYCRLRIDNPQDAEDVAAQVFAQAWRAYPPDDRGSPRSWVFSIAHNAVVNYYRRQAVRGPRRTLDDRLALNVPDDADAPEDVMLRRERVAALAAALDTLPANQRHVVELRIAGLKGAEIASVTGLTESAVKMLQFRAMKRLREHLLAEPEPAHEGAPASWKESADVTC